MVDSLRVTTFKDSNTSFLSMLEENGIGYSRIFKLSAEPVAAGITIEIILAGGWGAFAVACLAWAHMRKSRRINIITKENETIWLEGYSAKDAEQILKAAKSVAVIDTEASDEEA